MRIKRIYTSVAVMSKDHKFSFDEAHHKLEFVNGMISIDGNTLIPMSNIREILVEPKVIEPKVVELATKEPKVEEVKKPKTKKV